MYYHKNPQTGEVRELTEKESKYFDVMISTIVQRRIDVAEKVLPKMKVLAYAYDEDGETLLHYATRHANEAGIAITRLLVEHGADTYHVDNNGLTIFGAIANQLRKAKITQEAHDEFCRAINLHYLDGTPTTDSEGVVAELIRVRVRAEVDEEFAIRRAAEEHNREEAESRTDAVLRAADEYFAREDVQRIDRTIDGILNPQVRTAEIGDFGEDAIEAINDLYNKKPAFSSYLPELNFDFSSKGFLGAAKDVMDVVKFIASQYMAFEGMSSGGFLPMGFPHKGDDFGDFEPGSGGSSGAMLINGDGMPVNYQIVTILGNGTIVITDGSAE